jgi:hypothetical protein
VIRVRREAGGGGGGMCVWEGRGEARNWVVWVVGAGAVYGWEETTSEKTIPTHRHRHRPKAAPRVAGSPLHDGPESKSLTPAAPSASDREIAAVQMDIIKYYRKCVCVWFSAGTSVGPIGLNRPRFPALIPDTGTSGLKSCWLCVYGQKFRMVLFSCSHEINWG